MSQCPEPLGRQTSFEFDDDRQTTPRWVEVDVRGVRVENLRQFGGPWLTLHLIRTLGLDEFLKKALPQGRELVGWDVASLILVIARLCEPSSELYVAEQWYLLRTNVTDWSAEKLRKAYIQVTEAEEAFRIHKSDLKIRPIWHQKEDRVLAHVFVCFLAYVLWKTLGQMCSRPALASNLAVCVANSVKSDRWMSCCQIARAPRPAPAASQSRPNTNRFSGTTSA